MDSSPKSEQSQQPPTEKSDLAAKKEWVAPDLFNISETCIGKQKPGKENTDAGASTTHGPS